MQYYKTLNDEIVTGIGTVDIDSGGNITAEEYGELLFMILQMPAGKAIHDNGDGLYSYVDAPPTPEPEPTAEDKAEAYDILVGGAT